MVSTSMMWGWEMMTRQASSQTRAPSMQASLMSSSYAGRLGLNSRMWKWVNFKQFVNVRNGRSQSITKQTRIFV